MIEIRAQFVSDRVEGSGPFIRFPDTTQDTSMTDTETLRREILTMMPRLRRFARSLTGQAADADDLLQIALEKALTRLNQWQPGTRVDAWMFRIMKNAWIDEIRSRSSRQKYLAPEEAGTGVATDGVAAAEARLDLKIVQDAMAGMAPEQRMTVSLVLVEGFSYGEAASILEVPVGTITSRLARGRKVLEKALQEGASGNV